jgi:DNA-binding response OmpR family regulator
MPMRILLVEDDTELACGLRRALAQSDFAVDWIADGARADSILRTESFDLVVLDLTLPGLDGLALLRRLRARSQDVPVLIITARGSVDARVKGLDLGADDYLGKPFELAELEARVRALLRRSQGRASGLLEVGPLVLDTAARQLSLDGEAVTLPRREMSVLEVLMSRAGKVVSKEQIAAALYTFDDEASPNAIELYVSRLRKKLAAAEVTIQTVRGLGYVLRA